MGYGMIKGGLLGGRNPYYKGSMSNVGVELIK